MEKTKKCKSCDEEHPLTAEFWYFSKRPNGSDLVQCRIRKKKKIREYNENNRERLNTLARHNYEANPEKFEKRREEAKERQQAYMKIYRKENKERLAKANKDWVNNNKDRVKQKQAEWLARNNKLIFTAIFAVGFVLVIIRVLS